MEAILVIVLMAVTVGFIAVLFSSMGKKKGEGSPFQERIKRRFAGIDPAGFERICTNILENLKLEIIERQEEGEGEFSFLVLNPLPITGGKILVHALLTGEDEEVKGPRVMELSDNVISGRLSKGIFMTTGRFAPEVSRLAELAPMELIDGERLKELVDLTKIPV